ncbi:MAG: hypothetical protein KAT35_05475 [Candidatus Aenigmarchaeota archaeon]|nr:hypothetical protein [Candidatus Aenigmarchaeota archaeon]
MNELQEILLLVFIGYVLVKGTLLWLVHRKMLEIGGQARMQKLQKGLVPNGWTENGVMTWNLDSST